MNNTHTLRLNWWMRMDLGGNDSALLIPEIWKVLRAVCNRRLKHQETNATQKSFNSVTDRRVWTASSTPKGWLGSFGLPQMTV